MAVFSKNVEKYLVACDGQTKWWKTSYSPGETVIVSGIYRCKNCGKEIAANKDDPFPPQNHHQHLPQKDILWQLIVRADTKADNCGMNK